MEKEKCLYVLIVDDEEYICRMFRKWLSLEGHRVDSASTGKEAIDLIKRKDYDFVFLNIVLPGIRGVEILERIKEISPRTKVFMITGELIDKNLAEKLRGKSASGALQKPFTIDDIKKVIDRYN